MFEILTQEQVEKMSDRELQLSEHHYRHNLTEITNERYQRSLQLNEITDEHCQRSLSAAHEPVSESLHDKAVIIKARGRKKKLSK